MARRFIGDCMLDARKIPVDNSADGASLSSHGREAVDQVVQMC